MGNRGTCKFIPLENFLCDLNVQPVKNNNSQNMFYVCYVFVDDGTHSTFAAHSECTLCVLNCHCDRRLFLDFSAFFLSKFRIIRGGLLQSPNTPETWKSEKKTQDTFDHDKGTEICNYGAPSPLEALHWIFCSFSRFYVQFSKKSPRKSGESIEKSSGENCVKSCHVCGCHGFFGPEFANASLSSNLREKLKGNN